MFDDRSFESLYAERQRLMYDVDCIERGETVCIPRVYIKLLTRLHLVDLEIQRRENAEILLCLRAGALTGTSSLPEVGERDK